MKVPTALHDLKHTYGGPRLKCAYSGKQRTNKRTDKERGNDTIESAKPGRIDSSTYLTGSGVNKTVVVDLEMNIEHGGDASPSVTDKGSNPTDMVPTHGTGILEMTTGKIPKEYNSCNNAATVIKGVYEAIEVGTASNNNLVPSME